MNQINLNDLILMALKSIAPETDVSKINLNENLRDQVDLDSMDYLNFITTIGKSLHIQIPEHDYSRIESINTMNDYLRNKLKK